jgi:hypothetical protein
MQNAIKPKEARRIFTKTIEIRKRKALLFIRNDRIGAYKLWGKFGKPDKHKKRLFSTVNISTTF